MGTRVVRFWPFRIVGFFFFAIIGRRKSCQTNNTHVKPRRKQQLRMNPRQSPAAAAAALQLAVLRSRSLSGPLSRFFLFWSTPKKAKLLTLLHAAQTTDTCQYTRTSHTHSQALHSRMAGTSQRATVAASRTPVAVV